MVNALTVREQCFDGPGNIGVGITAGPLRARPKIELSDFSSL